MNILEDKGRVINLINKGIYFIVIVLLSTVTIERIPVGAIAILTACYASNLPLAPIIVMSIIGIIVSSPISFLIYFENQINTLLSFITAHPSNRGFVLNSDLTNVRLSGWDKDSLYFHQTPFLYVD